MSIPKADIEAHKKMLMLLDYDDDFVRAEMSVDMLRLFIKGLPTLQTYIDLCKAFGNKFRMYTFNNGHIVIYMTYKNFECGEDAERMFTKAIQDYKTVMTIVDVITDYKSSMARKLSHWLWKVFKKPVDLVVKEEGDEARILSR